MMLQALHLQPDFGNLIRVVAAKLSLPDGMVEKDYWVVQCLKEMKNFGWRIHFKGGTSLSKGYGATTWYATSMQAKSRLVAEDGPLFLRPGMI
ncbi:MAG: hypothetical protein HOM34_02085 [Planctomycetes bacterium]|jgi:hypothetical protein|nr:hypothetical protein [Planctomycetota bacterium]MBT5102291.1 hypothetical protein [Planctomycetota bacterium]MBT5119492.1 hypothetical protein [Planctomycetota bacterium]